MHCTQQLNLLVVCKASETTLHLSHFSHLMFKILVIKIINLTTEHWNKMKLAIYCQNTALYNKNTCFSFKNNSFGATKPNRKAFKTEIPRLAHTQTQLVTARNVGLLTKTCDTFISPSNLKLVNIEHVMLHVLHCSGAKSSFYTCRQK